MRWEIGGVTLHGSAESAPRDAAIVVQDFDPGESDIRELVVDNPLGDGVNFGDERLAPPTWTFDAVAYGDVVAEADALAAALAVAWRPAELRQPGATVPLRYEHRGRWRRVYGRPGKFVPDAAAIDGVASMLATFRLSDPLHFDDAEQSVTIRSVPPSSGGIVPPLVAPISTTKAGDPASRFAVVGGDAPAPLRITFTGPISAPWVRVGGVLVQMSGSIAYDRTVTVDSRAMTVLRDDGASVAGMLSPRTRMADLRLSPGTHEIQFGGTGEATVTVAWRSAWRSL